MQLVLLAAGKGSRLPKKYRNYPKCMVHIRNKNILEHNIEFYNKFKFKTIISGYKSNKLKNFIQKIILIILLMKNINLQIWSIVYSS